MSEGKNHDEQIAAKCQDCGDTKIDCPTCGYGMPYDELDARLGRTSSEPVKTSGGRPKQSRPVRSTRTPRPGARNLRESDYADE